MAVINKIRQGSGVALIVVAVALSLFMFREPVEKLFSVISGNAPAIDGVGTISGNTVDYKAMQAEIDKMTEQWVMTGQPLDETKKQQFINDAWNRMIFNFGYKPNFNDLGLTVSEKERDDMILGANIHPFFIRNFTDPKTKQFNVEQLRGYVNAMNSTTPPQNMEQAQFETEQKRWYDIVNSILDDRIQRKYENLLTNTHYVTNKEANRSYTSTNTTANVRYVYVPYFSIVDSTIEITDKDLNSYLKENSSIYESKNTTRSFDYIIFNAQPSAQDTAFLKNEFNEIVSEFKIARNDTMFVRQYSDNFQIPVQYTKEQLPLAISSLESIDSAFTTNPMLENGNLVSYKVTDVFEDTLYRARARHILIKADSTFSDSDMTEARKKAKLILDSLKRGEDFATLAVRHSEDFGSGRNGGDLGWFDENRMVPEFKEAVFSKEDSGLVNNLVKSQFGFHIIDVTNTKTNIKYVVSKVERTFFASDATKDDVYAQVSDFLSDVSTSEEFIAKADTSSNIQKLSSGNVLSSQYYLNGLGTDGRTLVKWAYNNADKNEVSEVKTIGDNYVIACLTNVTEEGDLDLEPVREEVAIKVRNAEKAKLISSKIDASLTLDDIAKNYGENISVSTANAVMLGSNSLEGVGFDPKFVGSSFSLKNGEKTKVIEGENGVVVIEMMAKTEPQPKDNYFTEKSVVTQTTTKQTQEDIFKALKELVEIKDNRIMYF